MGKVIKEFGQTYGTTDTAWVVPFPFWVDTAFAGGLGRSQTAIWQCGVMIWKAPCHCTEPKLFIVKANVEDPNGNDQETLDVLQSIIPMDNYGCSTRMCRVMIFGSSLYRNNNVIAGSRDAARVHPEPVEGCTLLATR